MLVLLKLIELLRFFQKDLRVRKPEIGPATCLIFGLTTSFCRVLFCQLQLLTKLFQFKNYSECSCFWFLNDSAPVCRSEL